METKLENLQRHTLSQLRMPSKNILKTPFWLTDCISDKSNVCQTKDLNWEENEKRFSSMQSKVLPVYFPIDMEL